MASAAVLGASGYLGSELLRLLAYHPSFEVTHAVAPHHAGGRLAEIAPHLERFGDVVVAPDAGRVDADVAFLALPPGEAMGLVPGLLERGVRVVDLGPDYRLGSAEAYAAAYGRPHTDAEHLAEAVYGLAERFAGAIRGARLVANPGCYPTATLLAVAPLVDAGAVTGTVVVDAKSGTSGSGATPSATTHHAEASGTVRPYGIPTHRHLPEIRRILGDAAAPPLLFVPHLVPLVRGILCSVYATPATGEDAATWRAHLTAAYDGRPFVRFGGVARLPWAAGTNRCYLAVETVDGRPVVFSVLDNLGKGGAGQAIQNANLMLGWDETTGLRHPGFAV